MAEFDERYEELRARYVRRLRERLDELDELVERLREEYDAEKFREVVQIVHRLAGSGETMGYPEVSAQSIELEERLEEVGESDAAAALEDVEAYIGSLREWLDPP